MRRACDWLVDRFVLRELDLPTRAALRLGAYQLALPRHARPRRRRRDGRRRAPQDPRLRQRRAAQGGRRRRRPGRATRSASATPTGSSSGSSPTSATTTPLAALESMNERPKVARAGRRLRAGPRLPVGGRGRRRRAGRAGRRPLRRAGRQGHRARRRRCHGRGRRRPAGRVGLVAENVARVGTGADGPTCCRSSPTAGSPPFAPGIVRPGAARRALLGPRLPAPPARRPLAHRRRRGRPPGRAAGRPARPRRRRSSAPAAPSSTACAP